MYIGPTLTIGQDGNLSLYLVLLAQETYKLATHINLTQPGLGRKC